MSQTVDINEDLEIVNADNSKLERMRKYNNTIDNGAISVLESLEEFCSVQLETYQDQSYIPYDKLFLAVQQVISAALDYDNVRDAVLTGVINKKRGNHWSQPVVKTATIKKSNKQKKERNKAAIAHYATNHTVAEICEHFGFDSITETKNYVQYHKLKYVFSKAGAKKTYDEDQIRELAKSMKGRELAKMFGVTVNAMFMYCKRHNIEYKK